MELFWKNTESLFCRQATLKDKHFTFLLLLSRAEKNSIKFWQLKKGRKIQFSSVQSLSHVRLFATPWTAARQTSLTITNSWNFLKLMSIGSGMPFRHLISSVQFSSVAQSCPTLYDPMNPSMPGLPVHHQLLEFTQALVHRVGDAIQPSHPLSSPSPPAPNPSQHQSFPVSQLFAWGGQSIGVSASASVLPKKSQG